MENIWLYEILGESWGVVIAKDKNEAEEKVRNAYEKHDSLYDENRPIIIKSKEDTGNWFSDSPDVLEVFG